MFIRRTISVAILIPLVIAFILFTSSKTFALVSAIFTLWAAWEWAILAGVKERNTKLLYLLIIFATLSVVQFIPFQYLLWVGLMWWLVAIVLLYQFVRRETKTVVTKVSLIMGFFALIPCWVGLNSMRSGSDGAQLTLLFLFLLWASDTGAYLAGTRFGRRKLAPAISPGKTYEGFYGGIVLMLLVLIAGIAIIRVPANHWLGLFFVAIITNIFAVIGDLFESMLKRKVGVKDSGNIIPGHGGILDRLDSMLAAAPVFALGALLIGLS